MFWRFLLFWLRPRQQPPQTVITVSLFESLKLPLIGLRPNSTQIWAQLSLMLWHLLKNFFRFRGGGKHLVYCCFIFLNPFLVNLATFVNGANPIENNARKFATVATYHLQCTGVVSKFVPKKNLCFKTVIREIKMKANTVGGRERGCILRLKVMSGHSTWFIISPNSAGTYRIFLFDHMLAKFDTSLWDSLFSFSCPSLTFSLVLGVSCVRF